MSGRLIRRLEDLHNDKRNRIASGDETNYPPCARMATMVSTIENDFDGNVHNVIFFVVEKKTRNGTIS